MKSVIEYLNECKQMADHNRMCYSATYGMDTPKPGCEKEFQEAVRDGEIADELINMVSNLDRGTESCHPNVSQHRVTRRGISWKGTWHDPLELLSHFGERVTIVPGEDGDVVFDGNGKYICIF